MEVLQTLDVTAGEQGLPVLTWISTGGAAGKPSCKQWEFGQGAGRQADFCRLCHGILARETVTAAGKGAPCSQQSACSGMTAMVTVIGDQTGCLNKASGHGDS